MATGIVIALAFVAGWVARWATVDLLALPDPDAKAASDRAYEAGYDRGRSDALGPAPRLPAGILD